MAFLKILKINLMYQANEDEIVFEADADLFNEQKTQVLVFNNKTKIFEVST